jgi:hypothetical protein
MGCRHNYYAWFIIVNKAITFMTLMPSTGNFPKILALYPFDTF